MEHITQLKAKVDTSLLGHSNVHEMFEVADNHVALYRAEEFAKAWADINNQDVTEERFLREFTWCIYVSNFSAKVISAKFDRLFKIYNLHLPSPRPLPKRSDVIQVFANSTKLDYMIHTLKLINEMGWDRFKQRYVDGYKNLSHLRGIGPALGQHLARNLGDLYAVKPDKHLTRLAEHYKFSNASDMVDQINTEQYTKTPAEIDLILWLASVDLGTL